MPDISFSQSSRCELCGREARLTFHHLIPRTVHSNKWFRKNFSRAEMAEGLALCRDCHSAVHKLIPNQKELGRHYNSRAKLLEHPQVARFVSWIARRRPGNRIRTRCPGNG